jgi:uncharacterized protein
MYNMHVNTKYRQPIVKEIQSYLDELDKEDFSHNSDHIYRVENMAKRIAKEENADMVIVEASCLLFDIARGLEDKGIVQDHAEKGVEIAKDILPRVSFPEDKIEAVCHAILSHRRSKDRVPETIEAKILRDSDYLDAMGAVDIARVIASALQSQEYRKPIFIDKPYKDGDDPNFSAIHFLYYKLNHPKHKPENFYTKLGKEMAKDRFNFMKEYADRFVSEWHGDR